MARQQVTNSEQQDVEMPSFLLLQDYASFPLGHQEAPDWLKPPMGFKHDVSTP